jgi:hypothetical protein
LRFPKLPRLPPDDLLRDTAYRRLWTSILTSSFGNQVMMLALPLTAAVLLHATPTQMGLLTAIETAALPAVFAALGCVAGPRAQAAGLRGGRVAGGGGRRQRAAGLVAGLAGHGLALRRGLLDGHGAHVSGTAAQIVLTQVVARDRLVEAHAKNALASSGAEVASAPALPAR